MPTISVFPKSEEAPILLHAQGLCKAFGGQVVLDKMELELRQGEVILLRGENGSGKTTLLNILTGNLKPDAGEINYFSNGSPRSYCFPQRWWQELNPFDHFTPEFVAREGIGRTWQDVRLFGSQSLHNNLAIAMSNRFGDNPFFALFSPHCVIEREVEINQAADAMLARLGLAGREDSSADKISLGQSKRVAIARAVLSGAKILFLDEPLSGLDRQGINDVLTLLQSLITEQGVTLVIVEHLFNQLHLHGLVTSDWSLAEGKLKRNGTISQNVVQQKITQEKNHRLPWISFFADETTILIDEPLHCGAFLTRIRHPEVFQSNSKCLLDIRNVIINRGLQTIIGLDDKGNFSSFSLRIYEDEIVVLQAPNGWGKTTLAEIIIGLLKPVSGNVFLDGQNISNLPPWKRRKNKLALVTAAKNVIEGLTVIEQLNLASVSTIPESLYSFFNKNISDLSGGQKQLVAVLSATGEPYPKVRIYDEPFAMLDAQSICETAKSMLLKKGTSILILVPTPLTTI